MGEGNDLKDRFVDLQIVLAWGRRFFDEGADAAADHLAGLLACLDDTIEGIPDLLKLSGG